MSPDVMAEMTVIKKTPNHVLYSVEGLILLVITFAKFGIDVLPLDWLFDMGRFAMPFFFIVSGYYLFSADGHSEDDLPRKIKHIIWLIVIIKAFFLVLDIIYFSFGIIDLKYLITSFVFYENTTLHIWFVYALLVLYIWWWLMRKYGLNEKMISIAISAVLMTLYLMTGIVLRILGVDEIFGLPTMYINNGLYNTIGVPFFTIGYYLHMYREEFDRMFSTEVLALLTVLGFVSPCIATNFIPGSIVYVGSVLASVGLFMLTFRVPEGMLRCRFTEFAGKELKPYLYMAFPAVVFFLHYVVFMNVDDYSVGIAIVGGIASIILNLALAMAIHYGGKAIVRSRSRRTC